MNNWGAVPRLLCLNCIITRNFGLKSCFFRNSHQQSLQTISSCLIYELASINKKIFYNKYIMLSLTYLLNFHLLLRWYAINCTLAAALHSIKAIYSNNNKNNPITLYSFKSCCRGNASPVHSTRRNKHHLLTSHLMIRKMNLWHMSWCLFTDHNEGAKSGDPWQEGIKWWVSTGLVQIIRTNSRVRKVQSEFRINICWYWRVEGHVEVYEWLGGAKDIVGEEIVTFIGKVQ